MDLQDILSALGKSKEFSDWRAEHSKAFLAHAFVMLDEPNRDTWQIGYFDEAENLMSTFVVQGADVKVIPDQEVLKAGNKILELNPSDVAVKVAEALAIAQKARSEHYGREQPVKTFFIIQNIEAHGPVFNITFFTASFKTINIKISTANGKVVHHSSETLAAFG